jgi:hypothetical protein
MTSHWAKDRTKSFPCRILVCVSDLSVTLQNNRLGLLLMDDLARRERRVLRSNQRMQSMVGSEEARLRASLRPPLKLHVRFSHAAFTKTHDLRCKQTAPPSGPWLYIRRVEVAIQYPRTMMYVFFAKRTDPPSSSLLF